MVSAEFEYFGKQINEFFKAVLGEDFIPDSKNTYYIPNDELKKIKPERTYPDPDFIPLKQLVNKSGFIEVKRIIDESDELLESLKNNHICNKRICKFSVKRLHDRLISLENKMNSKISDNKKADFFNRKLKRSKSTEGLNKKLENIIEKLEKHNEYCSDCKIYNSFNRLTNIRQIKEIDFIDLNVKQSTGGLFLPGGYIDPYYPESSILISNSLKDKPNELELTLVHENTHALLYKICDEYISKNKGLNEGFAVAMENYYVKWKESEEGNILKFNDKRYGEYLSYQILIAIYDLGNIRDYYTSLKNKHKS